MLVNATLEGTRITAVAADGAAVGRLIEDAKTQGGFMLELDRRPEPFVTCEVAVRAGDGFELELTARVVQIFEREGTISVALQLVDWTPSRDLELRRKLERTAAEATGDAPEGEAFGRAPIYRIRDLDPAEKNRLAMRADRAERQILCRDSSPQVLLGLLANPRLEAGDVLAIVKSTHASAGVLQRVAKDRRWAANSEITTALVRNPKTPSPVAIQLLEGVPTQELRKMARMGSLRENVRRAAFRLYTKRTSRR